MQKTIDVTELQSHFLSVFEEVTQENTLYILTRDGRPEAAILSYEEFLRFRRLQEEKLLHRFDQLVMRLAEQNAHLDEDEVAADISAALHEVK